MRSLISIVSPLSSYQMAQRGEPVCLVDVRTPAEYVDSHAEGAVSEPLDDLDAQRLSVRLGDGAGRDRPIHLLCASGNRAEQGARKLRSQGLENLMVVEGGTQAWAAQRLPMRRQTSRLFLERQTQIVLGTLILLMLAKGTLLHPLFFALIGLLGIGLIVAGVNARCGLAALLARMPWNRFQSGQPSSA